MRIFKAAPEDAARILGLQRRAYEAEARLYDDWDIPPLTQTRQSLLEEIRTMVVLKAIDGENLVGSVRANANGGDCLIGRLIVEPSRQRQGIGSRLLRAIEQTFPDVDRYELFTGHKSEGNIKLYRRHGYEISHSRRLSDRVTLVFMTKKPG